MKSQAAQISFTFVDFRNYKGFESLSLNLQRTNILVGPNNLRQIYNHWRLPASGSGPTPSPHKES